jgi:SAM-dependent methyltransferase
MNNMVRDFVMRHLDKLEGSVLEAGSLNVNGCVRDLVPHAVGTDMQEGPNVDVVCSTADLVKRFGEEKFDAVMSFDAFEHMQDWRECLQAMWAVLKKDGWLVMSMASPGKGFHGYPSDYWRADWELIGRIFPEADDLWGSGPSMGWVTRKTGPLPDLSQIDLIPIQ